MHNALHAGAFQAIEYENTPAAITKRMQLDEYQTSSGHHTHVTAMLLGLADWPPVRMASTLGCCAADSCSHSVVESLDAETASPLQAAPEHMQQH